MKIHSQIDLITNSSTEIFMWYSSSINKIKATIQSILDLVEPELKVEDIVSMIVGPKNLNYAAEKLYKHCRDNESWDSLSCKNWKDKHFDIKEFCKLKYEKDRVNMIKNYIFEIMKNNYEYPDWLNTCEVGYTYCRNTNIYYEIHNEKYKKIIDNMIDTITTVKGEGAREL